MFRQLQWCNGNQVKHVELCKVLTNSKTTCGTLLKLLTLEPSTVKLACHLWDFCEIKVAWINHKPIGGEFLLGSLTWLPQILSNEYGATCINKKKNHGPSWPRTLTNPSFMPSHHASHPATCHDLHFHMNSAKPWAHHATIPLLSIMLDDLLKS